MRCASASCAECAIYERELCGVCEVRVVRGVRSASVTPRRYARLVIGASCGWLRIRSVRLRFSGARRAGMTEEAAGWCESGLITQQCRGVPVSGSEAGRSVTRPGEAVVNVWRSGRPPTCDIYEAASIYIAQSIIVPHIFICVKWVTPACNHVGLVQLHVCDADTVLFASAQRQEWKDLFTQEAPAMSGNDPFVSYVSGANTARHSHDRENWHLRRSR